MIKINDEFSMDRDKYQWILYQSYLGKDRDGNPKTHTRETYYSKLDQIAGAIIDKSAKRCETIEELVLMMNYAANIVTKDLEKLV